MSHLDSKLHFVSVPNVEAYAGFVIDTLHLRAVSLAIQTDSTARLEVWVKDGDDDRLLLWSNATGSLSIYLKNEDTLPRFIYPIVRRDNYEDSCILYVSLVLKPDLVTENLDALRSL